MPREHYFPSGHRLSLCNLRYGDEGRVAPGKELEPCETCERRLKALRAGVT